MRFACKSIVTNAAVAMILCSLPGCYEDTGSTPQPQAQSPAPTAVEQGPINQHMSQGGGSALGGAKRSAENTIDKAQEESQRVADEADKQYD
jgi:hypothetical protein